MRPVRPRSILEGDTSSPPHAPISLRSRVLTFDGTISYMKDLNSGDRFTKYFLNKIPSLHGAYFIIFSISFISGMVAGFTRSLFIDLHEADVSYKDESMFAFINYPGFLRIITAPLVDIFFSKKVGKCKTYLVTAGLIMGITWLITAPLTEGMINTTGLVPLTMIWVFICQILVFYQSASDVYLLKVTAEHDKSSLSMCQDLGLSTGEFIAFNLYLPLSSIRHLECLGFCDIPLSTPLLTPKIFLYFMAATSILLSIYLLVFVSERVIEHNSNAQDCMQIGRVAVRMFSVKATRDLIIYLVLNRLFRSLTVNYLILKMMDYGFTKANMANVETVTFPLYFLISFFWLKELMVGRLMKINHWAGIICNILLLSRYALIVDLHYNQDKVRTFWLLTLVTFVEKFAVRPVFMAAFINRIAPIQVGSTFVASIKSLVAASGSIPATLGMYLVESPYYSPDVFILGALGVQMLQAILQYKYAESLDFESKEDFDVTTNRDHQRLHENSNLLTQLSPQKWQSKTLASPARFNRTRENPSVDTNLSTKVKLFD